MTDFDPTEETRGKSSITIRDGVGIINEEPVSTDVVVESHEIPGSYAPGGHTTIHRRQIRVDCGNGYALSIAFGSYLHGDNYDHHFGGLHGDGPRPFLEEVSCAEIAVIHDRCSGLPRVFEEEWGGDTVKGYVRADEIVYWIQRLREVAKENTWDIEADNAYYEDLHARMSRAADDVGDLYDFQKEATNAVHKSKEVAQGIFTAGLSLPRDGDSA